MRPLSRRCYHGNTQTNMASLLTDPLFEISGQGPAPDKNFYYFAVTKEDIIWRFWRISIRAVYRFAKPEELRESRQDFLDDNWLQSDIRRVFGCRILQYTKALCHGQYDYLERLSDTLLLQIINHLELEDVGQLGRTSRKLRRLCVSEEFWEQAVRQRCNTVSAEVSALAHEVGWRRVFFTSKLQLQKMINRRRKRTEGRHEEHASDLDSEAEGTPDESSKLDHTSNLEQESHPDSISV